MRYFVDKGVLQCGCPHQIFDVKSFGFFEIYGLPAQSRRERGVELMQIFCRQGGSIFL